MNPFALVGGGMNAFVIVGALSAVLATGAVIKHEYDAKIINGVKAKEAIATAEAMHAADQRTIEGLIAATATANARADGLAKLKVTIHAAKNTVACADVPAIRALVVGLRPVGDRQNAQTEPATGQRVGLPGSTSPAR